MMTIAELKQKGLILFECVSGSRAYGLDTEQSDTDIKGVFYLPREQFYGLEYIAQVHNESHDEVYYELGRFVELLLRNNPNILELLATPRDCIRYRHPLMDHFTPELFLSGLCKETFAGYAHSQVKKARGYKKKAVNPVAPERKTPVDFCYILQDNGAVPLSGWLTGKGYAGASCGLTAIAHTKGMYALYYDAGSECGYRGITSGPDANDVCLSPVPKGELPLAYLFFNRESYSAYCREYREYWDWVALRNETRYLGNKEHGKDYDAKNMMHTIRLLQVAEELLRDGTIRVKRNNREELLAIKRGLYDYEQLLEMADGLMARIETAAQHTLLPPQPDKTKIEAVLVAIRDQLYAR